MDFREYQSTIRDFIKCPSEIGLFYHTIGVAGAAGDLSNKVNALLVDPNAEMTKEKALRVGISIGDVLFNLVNLATDLGISLDEIITLNLKKIMMEEQKRIYDENKKPIKA